MDETRSILFHLDKDVLPVEELKNCISDFCDLLKDASDDCYSDIKWLASIKNGSVAVKAYPISSTETDEEIDECLSVIHKDLKLIQGGKKPSVLSIKTLEKYIGLVKTLSKNGKIEGDPTIHVVSPSIPSGEPVRISINDFPVAEKPIIAFGSAMGMVKSISAMREKFLVLYEESTGKRIKVTYKPEMLDIVRNSFENKVTVVGEIVYTAEGIKKEMRAEQIHLINNEKTERVLFSNLFGILAGENQ